MFFCCADPWTEDGRKLNQKKAWASPESLEELSECLKVVVAERNLVIDEFRKKKDARNFSNIACEKFTMDGVPPPVRTEKCTGKYC
jgi:hypothetical protein